MLLYAMIFFCTVLALIVYIGFAVRSFILSGQFEKYRQVALKRTRNMVIICVVFLLVFIWLAFELSIRLAIKEGSAFLICTSILCLAAGIAAPCFQFVAFLRMKNYLLRNV